MLESSLLSKREEEKFVFPKQSSDKRLVIGVNKKVSKEDTLSSRITAYTEQELSSDESMPDLTLLNVAVPIPLKSGQRVKSKGVRDSPSFLTQCTRATREIRFMSVMEGESQQSPERLPVQFLSISEERQTSSLLNFSNLAKFQKFGSFSLLSNSLNEVSADQTPLLNDLVERFLQNLMIKKEEVENLSQREKLVLDCFIRRKLKIGLEDYVMNYQSIDYGLLKVKRLEENYKMVFKSALKHLGNAYKKESSKKKTDDIGFYEYYFGTVSRQMGIPIEAFFHPNK